MTMRSSRNKTKFAWVLGAAAIAVAAAFAFVPGEATRTPASIEVGGTASNEKMKKLTRHAEGNAWIRMHGKGTTVFDVRIAALGKGVPVAGSSIELEATIRAKTEMTDVEFAWLLPDGVAAAGGAIHGMLGTLRPGETKTVRFSAIVQSNENRLVHLHVFRRGATEAVGTMAQHNTIDQARIERNLEVRAQKMQPSAGNGGERLRIMQ
jgi:hypothetical protein